MQQPPLTLSAHAPYRVGMGCYQILRAILTFTFGAAVCLLIGVLFGWRGNLADGPWVFIAIGAGITTAKTDYVLCLMRKQRKDSSSIGSGSP